MSRGPDTDAGGAGAPRAGCPAAYACRCSRPAGTWIGCGALRVLRVNVRDDGSRRRDGRLRVVPPADDDLTALAPLHHRSSGGVAAAPRRDHHGRQPALGEGARSARPSRATAAGWSRCVTSRAPPATWGYRVLTVYGFSTENWNRDAKRDLAALRFVRVFCAHRADRAAAQQRARASDRGLGVAPAGASRGACRSPDGDRAQHRTAAQLWRSTTARTRSSNARSPPLPATSRTGTLHPDAVDGSLIRTYLYTAGLPELDLLIRPGGERRLSNFLLYQAAYAELVMCDVYWPEFSKDDLARAIEEFARRQRRFGGA